MYLDILQTLHISKVGRPYNNPKEQVTVLKQLIVRLIMNVKAASIYC